MLRHLLVAVLLHIDRLSCTDEGGEAQVGGEVYARFRAELERSYATTRRAATTRSYPVTQPSGSRTGDGGDEPSRGT